MRKIKIIFSIALSLTMLKVSASNEARLDSLLQIAIQSNDAQKVKQLLAEGADPNMKFSSDLKPTPLMYASAFADGKILDMLMEKGVSLDEIDINGDPAINWATYYGHVGNMLKLIRAGANIQLKSKHGDALDVAFRLWHADSVIDVFRGTALDGETSIEVEQLVNAIRKGDHTKVKALIKMGINPDSKDGLGMPLLHHATRRNDSGMVLLLLENGANTDIFNRVGQTPLTIAARFGYLDIAELLIENGAEVNATGEKYQLTPLIGASVGGNVSLMNRLIESGATIDHKDVVNQCTALHWSIFYNNNEVAKILINSGASYTLKCLDNSYSAYTLSLGYKNDELKSYIEQKRLTDNPLIGSWSLKTINYIYADTTYKVDAHQGSLLVGESRYSIMYNPSWKARVPFENLSKPTDDEILAGFRSIVFNSGPYEIVDDVMLAIPDIAKVPGFEGGKQYYRYKIEGDGMSFRMYDETYPSGEKPEWFGKVEVEFIFNKE
ncbi:ankyrin repeat domain-containing protein [Ekhidna sp.]|uniref:ankyrin repeat domain-containing protein n=1 Tax=Ekhidna sp. TaxID=2608089 RepID=UPI0032F06919